MYIGRTNMYNTNLKSSYSYLKENQELYYLLSGLSYREIGIKFYRMNKNKYIYRIRKLMKELNMTNRRQLAFYAVKNQLISMEKIKNINV